MRDEAPEEPVHYRAEDVADAGNQDEQPEMEALGQNHAGEHHLGRGPQNGRSQQRHREQAQILHPIHVDLQTVFRRMTGGPAPVQVVYRESMDIGAAGSPLPC
jgi:hypothetical protein